MIEKIETEVVLEGRRDNQCWFSPLMTVVPTKSPDSPPTVHVQVTQQSGNDLGPAHILRTSDMGSSWSLPAESRGLHKVPMDDFIFETPYPGGFYHKGTGKLLGFGNTVFSRDDSFNSAAKNEVLVHDLLPGRHNIFSVWDETCGDWKGWSEIDVADDLKYDGNLLVQPCNQMVELDDGRLILPLVASSEQSPGNRPLTAVCEFDGERLVIVEVGEPLGAPDYKGRGFHEPSAIRFDGAYFMTVRSDREDFRMYRAKSADGIHWKDFGVWRWDDGEEVETENTQQHWLAAGGDLYLIYTRVNDMDDGVFRSRAPLFIAKVDSEKLTLIRDSEQVLFPAKGARMGNFTVANISDNEAWVMTGEWMERYDPDWREGMPFYCQIESNGKMYNFNRYIGDLLLARIFVK